jgi:hypothetical protein
MRSLLKRALMYLYCAGWISLGITERIYDWLNLKNA